MFDFGTEGTIESGGGHYFAWPSDGEKVALVDGDLLPYIVGYTVDERDVWKAKMQVELGVAESIQQTPHFQNAADHIDYLVNTWVRGAGCDSCRVYMTDSGSNFRLRLAFSKPYKGQRKSDKPPFFYELREYLMQKHNAVLAVGEEADDLISIEMHRDLLRIQQEGNVQPGSPEHRAFAGVVCCTQDKDLRMLPGWHYQPKTNYCGESVFFVHELGELLPVWKTRKTKTKGDVQYIDKLKGNGLKFFYAQILMGDTADNYPGLKGCGPAEAYELLNPCKDERSLYNAVYTAYRKKYPKPVMYENHRGGKMLLKAYDLMLEQGRLAYMQREPNEIWRDKKSPVLWGDAPEWGNACL